MSSLPGPSTLRLTASGASTTAPSPRKRKRSQVENELPAVTEVDDDEGEDEEAPPRKKALLERPPNVNGKGATRKGGKGKEKSLSTAGSPKKSRGQGQKEKDDKKGKQKDEVPTKTIFVRPPAISPEQRQERIAQKNEERRNARREEAANAPHAAAEERRSIARSRSGLIQACWLDTLLDGVRREVALRTAISQHGNADDLALVTAVVDAFTDHEGQDPIPIDVLRGFPVKTLALLADLARNPTSWDVKRHLQSGAIVLSKPTDPAPDSAVQNYIRRIVVGNGAVDSLCSYLCSHPADAPHTVLQLFMLGQSLDKTKTAFRESMVEDGLESAVDKLFSALEGHPLLASLRQLYPVTPASSLPYVGITDCVPCGKRGWDDLEGEADVRIVNFLETNDDFTFRTYRLIDMDTPIANRLAIRTTPLVSQKERVLRAVLGAMAFNSANGGVHPDLLPSVAELALRDRAFQLCPPPPSPLGEHPAPQIAKEVRRMLEDEASWFARRGDAEIDPTAFENAKRYAADVLRLRRGKVVRFEVAKDTPREVFKGKSKGYWVETVGQGPQEHRRMLRVLHPSIPSAGDLPTDLLALHVGPILDFWRLILLHLLYWLHILWLSRILRIVSPIILISQSNPMAAMIRAGDLADAWRRLSDSDLRDLQAGTTPDGLEERLPDRPYRQNRGDSFTEMIGKPDIVPTGPNPADLAIHIPHGDYGRLKYDPILKRKRWAVDFLVEIVVELHVRVAARALEVRTVDWDDELDVREFLGEVLASAAQVIEESGVGAALEAAKESARNAELCVNFLRALKASKEAHERWVSSEDKPQAERTTLKAEPAGPARQAQLTAILAQARLLESCGLNPDPGYLGSFPHPLLSDTWPAWFLGLKDNADIVASSNALGRTEKGAAGARANQANISGWRQTNKVVVVTDRAAIARNYMSQVIDKLAPAAKYKVQELSKSPRIGRCPNCGQVAVGESNAAYHKCDKGPQRMLTEKDLPDIERILYVHDILGNGRTPSALDEPLTVADAHNLVPVSLSEIVKNARTVEILRGLLRAEDFNALTAVFSDVDESLRVYIPEDRIGDHGLRVTLAIDVVLSVYSTCPRRLSASRPEMPHSVDQRDG
ncbi:hypothetical protein MSAN_00785300 [Mycena sanguinolenta]|uniref:Uncharacterized protein n=1 Tax=Mycena sanguinolenta TaxID=230812 RepID=A0A8H6Z0P9_9AGAR|nr:hypothetical protein MSAN_00785300 [Mycena sanguinolenta]